jgi:AcrR family transcriptional regulator
MAKPPRPYVSSLRAEAASRTRGQLITATAQLLREQDDFRAVTLDAAAKAAGVTRLTVYHQFGSRRGLLEAVFDELAVRGGLARIATAMAVADPAAGVDRLVMVFCEFWASDAAVGRLNEAAGADLELAEAVEQRNEARRHALSVLVGRYAAARSITAHRRAEVADLLYGLTGYAMFKALSPNRSPAAVCKLLQRIAARMLSDIER